MSYENTVLLKDFFKEVKQVIGSDAWSMNASLYLKHVIEGDYNTFNETRNYTINNLLAFEAFLTIVDEFIKDGWYIETTSHHLNSHATIDSEGSISFGQDLIKQLKQGDN